jgi:tetratricopeptide (TPR) repeat protein
MAYLYEGYYDLAIADFSKGIELDPNDHLNYKFRGSAYYSQGNYLSAIADYTEELHFNPDDDSVLSERADAYLSVGQNALAIMDLNKLLKVSNNPILIQSAKDRLKKLE